MPYALLSQLAFPGVDLNMKVLFKSTDNSSVLPKAFLICQSQHCLRENKST